MHRLRVAPNPIARRSLGDQVYERLAHDLLHGRYACGEELNEVSLAQHFQVSRTPIRDALRRLTAEGLVESTQNKRAMVIRPSQREIEETYQVRKVLESAAARLAAPRIDANALVQLRRLADEAVPPAGAEWGQAELRFDEALHHAISEHCGNRRLQREIDRYSRLVRFVRARVARNPRQLEGGHQQHRLILAALEARDAASAEACMAEHIDLALAGVLAELPAGQVGTGIGSKALPEGSSAT